MNKVNQSKPSFTPAPAANNSSISSTLNLSDCSDMLRGVSDSNELKDVCHMLLAKVIELDSKIEHLTRAHPPARRTAQSEPHKQDYPFQTKQKLISAWDSFSKGMEENIFDRKNSIKMGKFINSLNTSDLQKLLSDLLEQDLISFSSYQRWMDKLTKEGIGTSFSHDMAYIIFQRGGAGVEATFKRFYEGLGLGD